jgi:hypothetical protein
MREAQMKDAATAALTAAAAATIAPTQAGVHSRYIVPPASLPKVESVIAPAFDQWSPRKERMNMMTTINPIK